MDEENKNSTPTSEQTVDYTEPKVDNISNNETAKTEEKVDKKVEKKQKANTKQSKEEKPKKKKIGFIISIIIILLAVIGGAIGGAVYALVFAKTEIDLAKYVSIEFEGYEGYASFDEDDLIINEKELKKLLDNKSLAKKLAEKLLDKAEVKNNENLNNGDEIEVKFKISDSWLKENKIKLTSNTLKIKVTDLDEPNSIDLFKDLEFSYSGISPDLTVSLKNNSTDDFIKNKVYFTIETANDSSSYSLYDIANGDKITVKASYSQSDLENAGYVVKDDSYEFTVEGQAEYITSSSTITDTIKSSIQEKMLSKAKSLANSSNYDLVHAYSEDFSDISHYDYNLSHEDPVLDKMYIAINDNLDNVGYSQSRSIVYGVYKVKFTDSTTSKTYDYYITIEVKDLVTDSDGLYSGKTYYYNEFDNYYFTSSDGKDFHRSSNEVKSAIEDDLGTEYTLSEIN